MRRDRRRVVVLSIMGIALLGAVAFLVVPEERTPPISAGTGELRSIQRPRDRTAPHVADPEPEPAPVKSVGAPPRLRLVSLRYSDDHPEQSVASIQDRATHIIHLMQEGDVMPDQDKEYAVLMIEVDFVVLEADDGTSLTMHLEADTPLRVRRPYTSEHYRAVKETMADLAERGKLFETMMMAQWKDVGQRERSHVLQQGTFAAYYGGERGPDKQMVGLRAKRITPGSIWDQLGIQEEDLVTEINGDPVDSMDAWKRFVQASQDETDVTVVVERAGVRLAMRTQTIPPR